MWGNFQGSWVRAAKAMPKSGCAALTKVAGGEQLPREQVRALAIVRRQREQAHEARRRRPQRAHGHAAAAAAVARASRGRRRQPRAEDARHARAALSRDEPDNAAVMTIRAAEHDDTS